MRPLEQQGVSGRATPGGSPVSTPARLVAGHGWRGQGASISLALVGTLFLHGAVMFLAPEELPRTARADPWEERLEVFLVEPEEPEREDEFILTNPDVVSNPPDETALFSDRAQQAAQEEETDEGDPSVPDVDGELDEPNQNIVSQDENFVQVMEELLEELMRGDAGSAAFEPLPESLIPGFDPVDDAIGLNVPVVPELEDEFEESPVIGVTLGEGDQEAEVESPEVEEMAHATQQERVMPRPRPRLPQVSSGPTGSRRGSAPNVGTVAVDANFSEYGDYLARMLEAIVQQWHALAWDALPSGEVGTGVNLTFRIDSDGRIHGLEILGSTASLTATLICQDAVSSRQPYGAWTSDMREVLGDEQTIRIRFHYR